VFYSLKYSNLFLRLGLAAVFLWFGIDKFIHPDYWFNAWVFPVAGNTVSQIGIQDFVLIYILAVFELIVAIGLLTDIFTNVLSMFVVAYLVVIMILHRFGWSVFSNIGLIGAFLALAFWPTRKY